VGGVLRIGDLRHKIELQSFTSVSDGMGGFTKTWARVAFVRAAIWPIPAKEQILAASPTMIGTHRVRIRYYGDLTPAWRILFGTRYFSIVSIINPNEKNQMQELLCKEVL